ncbi:MAG: TlpA family protein disulfide reductase [Chitinophagaceae bacterium]|jgi:cytochrome c biogenesis protein CcmG, thiol:disulfide interchange protein DsbE|nr:TlpA family protein disulfide reductase [Chitinophagaceae bacterium]NCW88211.1 TlpA family protein disulfide reductase [Chitinophagia bacterium]NBY25135.1 TlpA family protein disulfide reductase [Chitinophagaceae bacterium]NDB53535.1 TlpA family protein disulfide reductase [Chitinophagaceae bacterium]NDE78417.1 TlpA family protein disulfide reductase [Chitinophagaceae bacterium]
MRQLFCFLLLFQFLQGGAQEQLPAVTVKSTSGKEITTQSFLDGNTPVVISFWATWCKPCLQELDAFNDLTETWKKETKARIIAISIDDSRTASGIKKTLGLHDWSFDVFWDENQEFKRALNITLIPHTIVVDKKGVIVKRYTAYIPGNEEKVLDLLKTL